MRGGEGDFSFSFLRFLSFFFVFFTFLFSLSRCPQFGYGYAERNDTRYTYLQHGWVREQCTGWESGRAVSRDLLDRTDATEMAPACCGP